MAMAFLDQLAVSNRSSYFVLIDDRLSGDRFGAVALICVVFFFKDPPKEATESGLIKNWTKLDPLGVLLLISAMVCLFLALQWGGSALPRSDSNV